MDEIKGETQRNFQTIMVVINHMVKEGKNKERVNGFIQTKKMQFPGVIKQRKKVII